MTAITGWAWKNCFDLVSRSNIYTSFIWTIMGLYLLPYWHSQCPAAEHQNSVELLVYCSRIVAYNTIFPEILSFCSTVRKAIQNLCPAPFSYPLSLCIAGLPYQNSRLAVYIGCHVGVVVLHYSDLVIFMCTSVQKDPAAWDKVSFGDGSPQVLPPIRAILQT